MAQTIKLKRSSTPGQAPNTTQLELGEVAINTFDGRMYSLSDSGTASVFEFITRQNNAIFDQDVAINGGDLTTTSPSFNLLDATPTTINAFGNATAIDIGSPAAGSSTTINSDEVIFPSSTSIQIPVGTTAERPAVAEFGDIRYNTDTQSYEGFGAGNTWGSLGGVKDVDQDTYMTTETSAGSDEDTFSFVAASNTLGTWNNTTLDVNTATNIDGNLTTTANTTLGNAAADSLTVNATSTFQAPVTMNGNTTLGNAASDSLTVNATSTFNGALSTTGNTTIGNAAADTLTVNATANFANNMTLGSSAADTITVNGTMNLNGGLTIQAGDAFTFDGNAFTDAHKFTIKNAAGGVIFGGWVFDTDANSAN